MTTYLDPLTPAASTVPTLPVAEMFRTFQGEGPSAGRLAAFLRLGGCNLTCARCDTPYTWDASRYNLREELAPMTAEAIAEAVPRAPLVVVTGGEPTLYRAHLAMARLLDLLAPRQVEIETNGTLDPDPIDRWSNVTFNVSPKLDGPMSVDPFEKRIVIPALRRYAVLAKLRRAVFKIVVDGVDAVHQAFRLVDEVDVPRDRVWLMPEGNTVAGTLATASAIADTVLAGGANLTLRQHVLIWPTVERGR